MLLVPQTGWAASFTIDDLKYESISYDEVKIIESPTARGDIVIPNTVTYGGKTYKVTSMENTFMDNALVKSVKLPDGIKSLWDPFYNASKLTSITNIPAHLEDAVHCPIYGTPFLKNQPDGVVYFSDWAVSVKGNPKGTLTFKEGTYGISSRIVCYNNSVTEVVLPQSLKVLSLEAFVNIGITKLEIPAGCTEIGENVACECPYFAEYIVAESNPNYTAVDGILYSKDMKTLENYPPGKPGEVFVCPSGVEKVRQYAFMSNRKLKHIYFQEGLKDIENHALQDQPLESVSFPRSLTECGFILYGCNKLKAVYCHATTPPLALGFFQPDEVNRRIAAKHATTPPSAQFPSNEDISETTLYVPAEAIDAYKNDEQWGIFGHFAAIENLPFSIGNIGFDNAVLNVISAFLDGGNITYDKDTKTLTLHNATISSDKPLKYSVIHFSEDDMTLNLVGNNSVSTSGDMVKAIKFRGNGTITGSGKLTARCDNIEATIVLGGNTTISNCTLDIKSKGASCIAGKYINHAGYASWGSDVVIDNANITAETQENQPPLLHFKSLALKNCGIVDPAGAVFDAEKHQIIGTDGNEVTGKIVISNSTAATGDINADGQVNVTDVTALINRVLGTASYSDAVCDLNGDGVVNVSDVTALINIILSNN